MRPSSCKELIRSLQPNEALKTRGKRLEIKISFLYRERREYSGRQVSPFKGLFMKTPFNFAVTLRQRTYTNFDRADRDIKVSTK